MKFGNASPLLGNGGVSAINEALQRRGIDISALSQVGTNAPTSQPMPVAPQGASLPPTGAVDMSATQPPQPQMGTPPLPQGQTDSEIILQALSKRLASDSKIKEAQNIPQVPKI